MQGSGLRIMLYSHNTRGLGHAARSIALAWGIYRRLPDASILYCGGSLHDFSEALPPNADYVKLPSFDARQHENSVEIVPARLRISRSDQSSIRRAILEATTKAFQPDALIADFYPVGKQQELVDALDWMKTRSQTRIYLGFRDVIDEPIRGSQFLARQLEFIRTYVDRVFIYGDPSFFDFISQYHLPDDVAARCIYTGFVVNTRMSWCEVDSTSNELGAIGNQRLIVASAGGGKDGLGLLASVINTQKLLAWQENLRWLVIAGPLMPENNWEHLREAVQNTSITLIRYQPNLVEAIRSADLFIGACGYNTCAEVIATGTQAILVPLSRTDESEQILRAELLCLHGVCQTIIPLRDDVESRLSILLESWIQNPKLSRPSPRFGVTGADVVAQLIEDDWVAGARGRSHLQQSDSHN